MFNNIWFIIITYYPKFDQLCRLAGVISPLPAVVVDNTPQIDEDNKTSAEYGKAYLIRNKINLGYSGGANVGIRYALGKGADWMVVLNDDLYLTKKIVSSMCHALVKTPPGIAGPLSGGLDRRRWTTIYPSVTADYISGSFFAIHRDVVNRIGYFYDPYFIYYEEVDYCLRAKGAGFPIVPLSIERIKHEESATMVQGSFLHQYYHARNHLLFVERQAPRVVKLYEYLRLPKTIWEHYSRGETGALHGMRDYFLRRFGRYNAATKLRWSVILS